MTNQKKIIEPSSIRSTKSNDSSNRSYAQEYLNRLIKGETVKDLDEIPIAEYEVIE